jgi:MFS family permease
MRTAVRLRLLYAITLACFTVFGMFLAALQRYVTVGLGGDEGLVGVAVGSFAVSALVLRPVIGRAVDRRGRRPLLLGSLGILSVVAAGFLLAATPALVVALRVAQGVGQAGLYVTVASMVVDLAPPDRRATAVSRFSLFLYAGLGIGPPLAELLIARSGFATTWLVAAAWSAAALAAAWLLPETGGGPAERAVPVGRTRLLHPAALAPGLVLLFPAIGYAAIVGFASLYADAIGLGAASGALYTAFAVTVIAVRIAAADVADRFGSVRVAWPGLGAAAAGLTTLALSSGVVGAFAGVIAFGLGFALLFPALLTLAVAGIPVRQRGSVVGSFTAFADLGIGGGAYVMGLLVAGPGFAAAFGAAAAGCVLSAVALGRLRHAP